MERLSLGDEPEAGPSSLALRNSTSTIDSPNGALKRRVGLGDVSLDERNLDHDIALLVSDWLHSRPHPTLASQFDQELLGRGAKEKSEEVEEVERAILDGEWTSLEDLISRLGILRHQSQRAFLYMCYRQQFLEHIDNREFQKAFNFLQKRLKPLEHYQPFPYDFYNLCYLTSAGTVHDAPGLRNWGGPGPERERLVSMWRDLVESSGGLRNAGIPYKPFEGHVSVLIGIDPGETSLAPQGRLVQLLHQAAAWQVSSTRNKGKQPWSIKSLLHDYEVSSVPNHLRLRVSGHTANIKCLAYIGGDERLAVSGSSDSTLRVFSTESGETRHILTGHTSRIWDCSVSNGNIASASGDGTARIWSSTSGECQGVLDGDCGDVYGVRWRPGKEKQLVSACYDRILRLWDVETAHEVRTFSGHTQSILAVAFHPTGNLIASGSKDRQVRLWDAVAGVCTYTVPACLGEITSVQFDSVGRYVLTGSKDNSNRLWDVRMQRNLYRYTGHQNTSKNLIRSSFAGPDDSLIISGSEDGKVYIWEREGATADKVDSTRPGISLTAPTAGVSVAPGEAASRTAPAYYPPRDSRTTPSSQYSVTTVKPLSSLRASASYSSLPGMGGVVGAVFDVCWLGDGEMMSASEDGTVQVWDTVDDKAHPAKSA